MLLSVIVIAFTLAGCNPSNNPVVCDEGYVLDGEDCVMEVNYDELYPEMGVYYQLFVRSFADSDGDGIGDFNGITENLDYFVEMGIDSLWLMPIHPSPTYHGYDVLDYYDVNEDFGTMEDFDKLVEEADKLGINIILDWLINHTSIEHEWFTEWMNGNPDYQGYYRSISSGDERLELNPGIWHSMGGGKYYAGYFVRMADLNWSNPAVQNEMVNAAKFWLEKGVDGFRLDAAKYLEGYGEVKSPTVPISSTLQKLEWFEYQLESEYPDVYITGEIFSGLTEFKLYYQSMDSALNFETGGDILGVINRGYSTDYVDTLVSNYNTFKEIDPEAIDAPFLFNHDQDRIATILNGNEAKLKLAAEMLLTLEGNPHIYYGEEVGMFGYKSTGPEFWDETRRLPLNWGNDYTTSWHPDTINGSVDDIYTQMEDPTSILYTYKMILNARQNSLALKYGVLEISSENNNALQAYTRTFTHDGEMIDKVLVLHNVTESEYEYGMDNTSVIYYSGGVENFDGVIAPRSTLILQLDTE
jgi:glycosidase